MDIISNSVMEITILLHILVVACWFILFCLFILLVSSFNVVFHNCLKSTTQIYPEIK